MKRWLWLALLLFPCAMHAQVVGPGFINYVTSAPSGTCSQGEQQRNVIGLGTVYTCQNGTWTQVGGAGGGVSSVTGTANQIDVATGTTTPVISLDSSLIFPGTATSTINGALSQAAITITGAPIGTGGTGTTTFPLFYFNCSGSNAVTSFTTTGTVIGMNECSGWGGDFLNFRTNNGAVLFKVASSGAMTSADAVTAGAAKFFNFTGRASILSPVDGVIQLSNNAQNAITRVDLGGTTSSTPAFCVSGTIVTTCLGDGTTGGTQSAALYATAANCNSGASPAVCGAAASGSVAVPAGTNSTLQINTTAVTANSVIILQSDDTLGTKLTVTCNSTIATLATEPIVTARSAGVSFTITVTGTTTANPACFNYFIVN